MGYEAHMLQEQQEQQQLLLMQQQMQRAAEQEERKERSWRMTYIVGVPTLLLPLPLYMNSKAGWCVYCMVWMAMYWTTEIIPLPATALLPLAMFPLLGILSTGETTALYFNDIGFIILSSLTLAVAVECTNLHKRIALKSLLIFGMSKRRIVFAIMMISMFLSLWIPNTASASIMGPITVAVADQMQKASHKFGRGFQLRKDIASAMDKEQLRSSEIAAYVRKMMLLSVTYACNVGGTGSLIGTAPNQILKSIFDQRFPEANELTYAWWMLLNVPAMIVLVLLAYSYVQWSIERKGGATMLGEAAEARLTAEVTRRYNDLGPLTFAEATVVFMLVLTVFLLLTMRPQILPGWASMFPEPYYIRASVPMVVVSVLLFVIPRDPCMADTIPILTWDEVNNRVSWGTVLVICGGMTLAEASKKSGLSRTVATTLAWFESVPRKLVLSALCLLASFTSELASNSAVSSLMIPVVIDLAVLTKNHPLYYALPVAVCCSFSFMLPAATPTNAIVYHLGHMTPRDMARPGVLMNLMTVAGEIVSVHVVAVYLLGLDSMPWWAKDYSINLAGTNTSHVARAARRAAVDVAGSVQAPSGPHARW
ncbi:solute carrier family 13 member 4-like [Rhipicephalus sanguineus]|uniref:solute carrier family 13 member 4-like n=1 Tax=Rhipicephalus sanguineus TaxID=34632 RepID=UPI001895D7A7|nr:solute carrier family 13 member 4-like [Rhipicephalus sanguineus]